MAESDDCFYYHKVPQLEDKLVDIDKEIRKETIDSDTLLIQLNKLKAEIDNYEGSQDIIYYYYRMQFHIRMKELCSHRGDETNSKKHDRNHLKYLNQFEEAFQASENQSSTPSIETINEQDFEVINDDIDDLFELLNILKPNIDNNLYQIIFDFIQSISKPFSNLRDFIAVRKNHYNAIRALNEMKLQFIQSMEIGQDNNNQPDGDDGKKNAQQNSKQLEVKEVEKNIQENEMQQVDEAVKKLQENDLQSDTDEATKGGQESNKPADIIAAKKKELQESSHNMLIVEYNLRECLQNKLNQRAVHVVELCLSDEAALRSSMFDFVELTERNIINRYRLLCHFHPDRFPDCINNDVFKRFFQILCSEKELALNKLQSNIGSEDLDQHIIYHRKQGDNYWRLVIDWQEVSKGSYHKCTILKPQNYENLSLDECITNKINHAKLCYQHYRAACKIIDALASDNKQKPEYRNYQRQQIEIRKFMALALYVAGMQFEAQLYAIGALRILLATEFATEEEIKKIRNILAKTKSTNTENVQQQPEPSSQSDHDHCTTRNPIDSTYLAVYNENSSMSLAPVNSPIGRKQQTNYLRQDIAKLAENELIVPQANLVCYNSPDEPIILARREAGYRRLHGIAVSTLGAISVAGSPFMAIIGNMEVFAVAATFGSLFTPIAIATGITAVVAGFFGVYFGRNKMKEGRELLQEPQLRENLNKIITEAVAAYSNNQFQQFFEKLSHNYAVDQDKNEKYLIRYQIDTKIEINFVQLIDELLSHEFRPDGIAYLLVIIGEALIRSNINLAKIANSTRREIASNAFQTVFESQKLREEAERIDDLVYKCTNFNRSDFTKIPALGKLSQKMFYSYHSIPESYVKDAEKSPFINRLQEITLLARLNYALVQIINCEEDNIQIAKEHIVTARNIVAQNFQFFSVTEYRLSTIEDLLSALGQDPSLDPNYDDNIKSIGYFTTDIKDQTATATSTFSYVTELDQNVDIWHIFNVLSNGRFALSPIDFLEALKIQDSDETNQLVKQCGENTPDWQILQYRYLPLISKLTRLQFELYQIIPKPEGQQQSVKLMPTNQALLLDDPIAIICLGVKQDYYDDGVPQFIFIHTDNDTLKELYNKLHLVQGNYILTAEVYLKIADHYMAQAKCIKTSARQLTQFNEARQFYFRSLRLFPTSEACWMITDCYLACGQNKNALRFLKQRSKLATSKNLNLASQSQFFYYRARGWLGIQDYEKASININKALKMEPNNKKYQTVLSKINKLNNCSKSTSTSSIISNEHIYNQRHRSSTNQHYNILSIDGGGVRGIIPAVVLCELERDTKKPISHSFNLLAGTSTGGIITLGLSIPQMASVQPKYRATDILSLYTEHSSGIFHETSFFNSLFVITRSKYSSDPLTKLLKTYYGDIKLSQLLTDVAIPACNLTQSYMTTYFTRYKANRDTRQNFSVLDVALATSAAPTYFPPHEIVVGYDSFNAFDGPEAIIDTFADGGIQANNPASYAYKHAIEIGNDPEYVHMLSLGTGDYIQNFTKPGKNRGLLFWMSKVPEIIGAQQNNVDDELNAFMGSRYHRWQYWLEDAIRLDDVTSTTIDYLVNAGYGLVEDLRADDDNSWNKLVEHLNDL